MSREESSPIGETGSAAASDPNLELVTILETVDGSAVPVIQSILQAAGIPFLIRDLHSLGMRPQGGLFGGASPEWGTAVQVPANRAEEARGLLELSDGDCPRRP